LSELLHVETTAPAGSDGDAAALYSLYRDRIREYCVGQLRDRQEAEDALQTTFLYAFTLLERGTQPRRPLPWLYTIAHNVCRTRRRALKRRNQVESPVDLDTLHESIGRPDPPREDVAQLETFLAALPATQRTALLLREWQGLSYSEIAGSLGISESAVEAVLFRARRTLARQLRPVRERVASVVNGALLLPLIRRLAPAASSAKAAVTTVAVGTVAATALVPLGDSAKPAPTRVPIPTAVQTQPSVQQASPAAALVAPVRGRAGAAQPEAPAPARPTPAAPSQFPGSPKAPVAPDVAPTPSNADAAPQPSAVAPPEHLTAPPPPAPPVDVQTTITTVADTASNAVSDVVASATAAANAVADATGQTLPSITVPQPPNLPHILP
jgi:RNA polymerase sigma factor (sigma-70 family)